MPRTASKLILVAALVLLALPAGASAAQTCVTGGKARAAEALYGSGTEVVGTDRVAGMRTALVLEPLIAPGTRHRMIATAGGWCDATTGFNEATSLTGAQAATTYARLAAAPYFDGVTIRDVRSVGNVHTITTHAHTNGVVARWVIATDAQGVRSATWTATAFAQRPFTAQIEGLTALPDATASYERAASGALRARQDIAAMARAAEDEPGIGVGYTGSDGFRLEVSYGDTRVAPQLGQDTGAYEVDFIRITQRAAAKNYEDFMQWGLTSGWGADPAGDERGLIYINDALSAYCLACVLIADHFNIHLNSHAHDALGALGYMYPGATAEEVWSDIIGHEMFHNFQNRYNKPGPVVTTRRRSAGFYYMEGTARLQESFHDYNEISHQPESLIYANDGNGCNGFDGGGTIHVEGITQSPDMDREMVKGPFNGSRTYSACYFWMPWYVRHGWDALRDLMTRTMPAAIDIDHQNAEGIAATTAASGETMFEQLQMFAVHALTGGRGMNSYGAILGGPVRDWSAYLESWTPKPLERGTAHTRKLQGGGMMANEITERMRVAMDGPRNEVRMFVVRDDGTSTSVRRYGGARIVPHPGERVFVVAARPGDGSLTSGGAVNDFLFGRVSDSVEVTLTAK
jgi:hypothetical protein